MMKKQGASRKGQSKLDFFFMPKSSTINTKLKDLSLSIKNTEKVENHSPNSHESPIDLVDNSIDVLSSPLRQDSNEDFNVFSKNASNRAVDIQKINEFIDEPDQLIKTPNYKIEISNYTPDDDVNHIPPMCYSLEQMKETHFELEIAESRIKKHVCSKFKHPAQSGLVLEHEGIQTISIEEIKKRDNYHQLLEEQKTPKFWEPRVWDSKETIMDENESNKLLETINQEVININEKRCGQIETSKKIKKPEKHHKKESAHIFLCPSLLFSTDESDDNTDFDMF